MSTLHLIVMSDDMENVFEKHSDTQMACMT